MKTTTRVIAMTGLALAIGAPGSSGAAFTLAGKAPGLEQRFLNPPLEDRLGVYWFWSNATDEGAITRDLEAMAHVGIGRAVLSMTQAHSATLMDGTGTVFLSPRFLELFRFALDEAARLGIRITAIPSNGWYQGGPWVTPEMGPQMLVWSRIERQVSETVHVEVPPRDAYDAYYDDFDGLSTSSLDGTAPDTRPGPETWAADGTYQADGSFALSGSGAVNKSAFLPFTPVAGKVYTLSVDVAQPSGGDADTRWAGLAFGNSSMLTGSGPISGWRSAATLVYRQSGAAQAYYGGDGTSSGANPVGILAGSSGTQTLKMVLDTTAADWKVDYFIGANAVGSHTFDGYPGDGTGTPTADTRPIANVGISINGAGDFTTTFDNFALAVIPGPDPGSGAVNLPVPDRHRTGRHARIAAGAINHLKPVAVLAFQRDANGRLLAGSKVDLCDRLSANGDLSWEVPAGDWVIYRFGHVPNMVRMKQDSPGYGGLQIDHMSRAAMERHLDEVAVPMLEAAGPHVGKTLDRLHEDSMEIGFYDWTPLLPGQFKERRGYDLVPLLPLLAGDSFTDGPPADRVEHDFEELLEDLLIDEHYGAFRAFCHRHGLTLVAESGHTGSGIKLKGAPVDHVMDEFWTHFGLGMDSIILNRNAAFAAQVYGQNRYTCEAFTSHQQWLETPAQLKDLANGVYARGVNHLTIHGFSSSPAATPPPGDVYFAGTHFNPGVTWWDGFARPLAAFFNRCQTLLSAGLPVVDMLYIDGPALQEMIKTNEMLWESDRRFWKFAGIPGERLAEKAAVNADGRIELPDGPSYPVLVVADTAIELAAMRAVARLVEQGATAWFQVVPDHTPLFSDGPEADAEIRALVKTLGADRAPGMYQVGAGRILTGADRSGMKQIGPGVRARTFYDGMHGAAMDQLGIPPAFSYGTEDSTNRLCFFQRNADGADLYFVANALRTNVQAECAFRVAGKQPERWDPVSGELSDIQPFSVAGDRTVVPLEFAPHESFFVVFRKPVSRPAQPLPEAAAQSVAVNGPWEIAFDPAREGLESFTVESDSLLQWDTSADPRIADFSGTAVYRTTVEMTGEQIKSAKRTMLDLGQSPGLYKLTGMGPGKPYGIDPDFYDALCAEVVVNGEPAGVLWCSPYRMDVSTLVRPGTNKLEIRVANTWHNWRLANEFTAGTHPWETKGFDLPPAPSGLLGPLRLEVEP